MAGYLQPKRWPAAAAEFGPGGTAFVAGAGAGWTQQRLGPRGRTNAPFVSGTPVQGSHHLARGGESLSL